MTASGLDQVYQHAPHTLHPVKTECPYPLCSYQLWDVSSGTYAWTAPPGATVMVCMLLSANLAVSESSALSNERLTAGLKDTIVAKVLAGEVAPMI